MAFRRLLALFLALLMLVTLLPAVHAEEAAAEDFWAQISAFEDAELAKRPTRATTAPTAEDFAAMSEDVEQFVVSSGNCIPGSVIRHGSFFYWTAADGEVCGYSPRLRAKMRAESVDPTADPEALGGVETVSYVAKGGSPGSADVAVFQPYIGLDSSFSSQYANEGRRIAAALSGTGTTYKTTAATVDQIAMALEDCAVVIFDSHGDTDYANPRNADDYVTQANTSYLCMQTNAGWTDADRQAVQGPYGTYYHAYNAGSYGSMRYYCVDGTVFANHMQKSGCNNFLWMAICLGMATDGMYKPLREHGVEAVYGYSQSVSFDGDYEYEEYFWDSMREGHAVGASFAYMKEQAQCDWDPAFSSIFTLARARFNFVAFPNVVSSEDEYQGHRTVNPKTGADSSAGNNNDPAYGACNIQTVNSTWTLLPQAVCEHDYIPEVTAPTCTEQGYTTYVCSKCGDTYVGDYVDALGHTSGEPVKENETVPTCTEIGGYDTAIYCAVCGDELSRVHTELAALGHDWDEPEYTWNADHSAISAKRTCKNDETHAETEQGAITSEVTHEATIDAKGEIVYTAVFLNPAFTTQTEAVAVPRLDDGLPCDGGASCPGVRFTDMPAKSSWAHDAIDWAVVHGVTAGTSATTFSPNAGCTRAQVVTFLYRAAGEPAPKSAGNPFTDVSKDAYYYNAVLWAVENDVTAGTAADKFSPDSTCTRAQIVTFLWRYEGKPAPTAEKNPFKDVPTGAYYEAAVLWASESGVTAGTSATTFSPEATCTRAQVVTFLYRDVAD